MLVDYPKVELHLHLEGIIPFQRLQHLYAEKGQSLPAFIKHGFPQKFPTFFTFVETFYACCRPVQTEADFKFYIEILAAYLAENNLIYAEISWTPFFYMRQGLSLEKMLGVMNEELENQSIRSKIRFIIDVQRDNGDEIMDLVFSEIPSFRDLQIAGIGMTGDEYQPIPHRAMYWFERLHGEHNLGRTVHAGEYGNPEKIREVLIKLKPERLGHGINAIKSAELMDEIKKKGIHLENCPTSNVKLNRVTGYEVHPIKQFLKNDISVSINSDDPGIFEMPLQKEIEKVVDIARLTIDDCHQLNQNALNAAFISGEEKKYFQSKIKSFNAQ